MKVMFRVPAVIFFLLGVTAGFGRVKAADAPVVSSWTAAFVSPSYGPNQEFQKNLDVLRWNNGAANPGTGSRIVVVTSDNLPAPKAQYAGWPGMPTNLASTVISNTLGIRELNIVVDLTQGTNRFVNNQPLHIRAAANSRVPDFSVGELKLETIWDHARSLPDFGGPVVESIGQTTVFSRPGQPVLNINEIVKTPSIETK